MRIGDFTTNFMRAHRASGYHQNSMSKALQRLSTGKRINSAADDAAGLAISEKFRAQLNGLNMQVRNYKDEINMLNTKDSLMSETQSILQRMKELASQASNGTYTDEDRALLDIEYQALMGEIDRIYTSSDYNGITLLSDEDYANLQNAKGSNEDEKVLRDTSIKSQEGAQEAIDMLEDTIYAVSYSRAGIGANVNVLDHRISAMQEAAINAADSLSTIEDADMAQEMMNYTKASILNQVAQAMMAHTMNDSQRIVDMLKQM
ncbi:flagellin [Ruminococcaceae bacterium OttesenSCG-928-L11]|nr:flagellin [Ruminococcaceae bacterium OttesenSCG-928-L11]